MTTYYVKIVKDRKEDDWRLWNPFHSSIYIDKEEAERDVHYARDMKKCWAAVALVEIEL